MFERSLLLSVTPDPINGAAREPISFSVIATVSGPSTVSNAVARLSLTAFSVQSVTSPSGSCPRIGQFHTCSLGTPPGGSSTPIDVTVMRSDSGTFVGNAHVEGLVDGRP